MTMRTLGTASFADRRRVAVARPVPYYLRTYGLPPDPVFVTISASAGTGPTVNPARSRPRKPSPAAMAGSAAG